MSERNKLLSVLVVGLLVGFGVGRLTPQQANTTETQALGESDIASEKIIKEDEPSIVSESEVIQVPETGAQLSASVFTSITGSSIDRPQVQKVGYGINVGDQPASDQVMVASVAVLGPTWIAVHADRDGLPGNVFGAYRIETNLSGVTVDLLRDTEKGMKYYVVLQEDNGNGKYDLYLDSEIVTSSGALVYDSFVAQ